MRDPRYRALAVICLYLLSVLANANTTDALNASVSNPERAFGYSIGDVIEQKIVLSATGNTFKTGSLPAEQREGRWVSRNDVTLSTDGSTLTLYYQIINAPVDVRVIALPELLLQTSENIEITVPAWTFTITPLIPGSPQEQALVPLMQADSQPQLPSTDVRERNLKILTAALAVSLAVWLLWWLWRNWREARTLPFAKAFYTVRGAKLNAQKQHGNDSWLALHEAFNRCAGKSVAGGSVPELLATVEWLKPLEQEIQQFFKLSSTRFFSPALPEQSFNLKDFAKRLYSAEKRHNGEQKTRAQKTATTS